MGRDYFQNPIFILFSWNIVVHFNKPQGWGGTKTTNTFRLVTMSQIRVKTENNKKQESNFLLKRYI